MSRYWSRWRTFKHWVRRANSIGLLLAVVSLVVALFPPSGYLDPAVREIQNELRAIRHQLQDSADRVTAVNTPCEASKPPNGPLLVDLKANDCDSVLTVDGRNVVGFTWSATGATACQMQTPTGDSGISLAGTDSFGPDHPWYPRSGETLALTINCTDGVISARDAVVIRRTSAS